MSTKTTPRSRQPKGVTIGGQFKTEERSDALVSLADSQTRDARVEQLLAQGFVPAVPVAASYTPMRAGNAGSWWDEMHLAAEYRPQDNGYPKMSDDDLMDSEGLGMRGSRRVRRILYRGDNLALRMPSVTSIRRFAKDSDSRTFDVPVTMRDDTTGEDVSAWVRVTAGADSHTWSVRALGVSGDRAELLADAVSATLESRRPRSSLEHLELLREERKARAATAGGSLRDPKIKGWISEVGYDQETGVAAVRLAKSDKLYGYKVSRTRFEALAESNTPGVIFNTAIKTGKSVKVEQCEGCGRFWTAKAGHTCPVVEDKASRAALEENSTARARTREIAAGISDRQARDMRRAAQAERERQEAEALEESEKKTKPLRDPNPTGVLPEGYIPPVIKARVPIKPITKIDLNDWFNAEIAGRTGKAGEYGSPGFTKALLPHLSRYTEKAYVPDRYDRVRVAGQTYGVENGMYGMVTYAGLGGADAASIGRSLSAFQLKARHNGGPDVRSALLASVHNADKIEVAGFLRGPSDTSESFKVAGVHLFDDSIKTADDAWAAMENTYGIDAQRAPDEVELIHAPWRGDGTSAWRARWS